MQIQSWFPSLIKVSFVFNLNSSMQIFRWGRRIWAESKQKASVESTLRLILRNFALHPITPRPKGMSRRIILRLSIWNFAFDRLSAPEHSFASLIIFQRLSAPEIIPSPTNIRVQVPPVLMFLSYINAMFFCSPETFFKISSNKGCDECTWGTCCCTLFADLADFHKEKRMMSRIIMAVIFIYNANAVYADLRFVKKFTRPKISG